MYSRVRVWRTLEYILPGCRVLLSTSYPGVVCSRVSSIRVWRTLESMVTAVAMDSCVQKLPRVRGGSSTGEAVEVFVNTAPEKYLYISPKPEKPEKYLYIYILQYLSRAEEVFIYTMPEKYLYTSPAPEKYLYTSEKYLYTPPDKYLYTSPAPEKPEKPEKYLYTPLALVFWAFTRIGVHRPSRRFPYLVFSIRSCLPLDFNRVSSLRPTYRHPFGPPFTYSLFR